MKLARVLWADVRTQTGKQCSDVRLRATEYTGFGLDLFSASPLDGARTVISEVASDAMTRCRWSLM